MKKVKSPPPKAIPAANSSIKAWRHEFYHVAFRKKSYKNLDQLHMDADAWLRKHDQKRPYQAAGAMGKRRGKPSSTIFP